MTRARAEGTVVLGAGLAGLSAGFHAGAGARVYEAQARPGGECVTDRVGPFAFDRSGHLLHLRTPEARALLEQLCPKRFRQVTRDARVRVQGCEVRYPIQANTFGLPAELKAKVLHDYLAAANRKPKTRAPHFAQWAVDHFGETLAHLFFHPYNRKLWTVPPETLTTDWMGAYVPDPDPPEAVRGAFTDRPGSLGYNAKFWYPKQGGIEVLANALAARVQGLRCGAKAVRVDARRRTADIQGHGRQNWARLISTLPLPELVRILDSPPAKVREAARQLRSNQVLVLNLGVRGPAPHPGHWIYFPDPHLSFYRVGFPSNFGRVAPADHWTLYAEVALARTPNAAQVRTWVRRIKRDLNQAGLLATNARVAAELVQRIPYAYVIFDRAHAQARRTILDYLAAHGIRSIGRWGGWEYSAMEDALLAGRAAAKE